MDNSPLNNLDWLTLQTILSLLSFTDQARVARTCKELRRYIKEELHIKTLSFNEGNARKLMKHLGRHAKWLKEISTTLRSHSMREADMISEIINMLNNSNTRLTSLRGEALDMEHISQLTYVENLNRLECCSFTPNPTPSEFLKRLRSIDELEIHGYELNLNEIPTGNIRKLKIRTSRTHNLENFFTNNPQCTVADFTGLNDLNTQKIETTFKNVKNLQIYVHDKNDIKNATAMSSLNLDSLTIGCSTVTLLDGIFRKIRQTQIKKVTLTTEDNNFSNWNASAKNRFNKGWRSSRRITKRAPIHPNIKIIKLTLPTWDDETPN